MYTFRHERTSFRLKEKQQMENFQLFCSLNYILLTIVINQSALSMHIHCIYTKLLPVFDLPCVKYSECTIYIEQPSLEISILNF